MSSGDAEKSFQSDLDAEIAQLSAVISRDPRDFKAYRRRGLLKARYCRYDDALQDFQHALTLAPDDGHTYGLRALVWTNKGDRNRALSDFDAAIRLAPRDATQTLEQAKSLDEAKVGEILKSAFEMFRAAEQIGDAYFFEYRVYR
jgi:tetratricopeptide (TPR) repeat protein